jgi:hypothetical protein
MRGKKTFNEAMAICNKAMALDYGAKKGMPYIGFSAGLFEFYGDVYVSSWNMYNETGYKPFERLLKRYFNRFALKQMLEFGDCVKGVAKFGDYYFSIEDIIYDLENNVKRYLIRQWQDDLLEYNKNRDEKEYKYVNFKSYCMGFRYSDLE